MVSKTLLFFSVLASAHAAVLPRQDTGTGAICQPGWEDCFLVGCTDIQNSEMHCGACGNWCPNGPCVNGKCERDPEAPPLDETTAAPSPSAGSAKSPAPPVTSAPAQNAPQSGPCGPGGQHEYCTVGGVSQCIDLKKDPKNCGYCENKCPDGQLCYNGACSEQCKPGWEHCFLIGCTDVQTSSQNCGACGNWCSPSQVCRGGKCVDDAVSNIGKPCDLGAHSGGIECPGAGGASTCVDPSFDPNNCGGCGAQDPKYKCAAGSSCQAGKCVAQEQSPSAAESAAPAPTTPAPSPSPSPAPTETPQPQEPEVGLGKPCNYGAKGFLYCSAAQGPGFECFNTLNDNRHCGACGNDCRPGENCVDGKCAPPGGCGAQTYCPGSANGPCVNLDNDNTNCGACGRFCKPGQNCWGGKCS
ncbi:hypothetical protein CC85DRAFT_300393 [Cutaneotrichosporon oleaginosum]|uniref:TNFR-Cys domain-containing protein n=1 Tax=Cutaneotrichosporon oleaginosum TaxID=879819 RepID=A0A0J1B9M9_9TREE|nr:uncharacterized protein CC85DRAFT_300393 [Cutaneotrichosporon oleaginosum]KLT44549.1 hypothetical protein CC85DRAFT_300393 [Cutaneotrichosporon oleaginosum]TXT13937.1 hypothetical protein COLE_00130 [Cutaneotrichosporon oleaginosum]